MPERLFIVADVTWPGKQAGLGWLRQQAFQQHFQAKPCLSIGNRHCGIPLQPCPLVLCLNERFPVGLQLHTPHVFSTPCTTALASAAKEPVG